MIAQPQVEISEKANFRHLVGDITWFGLALAATSRFLSVYAIRLGATPIELGLISSLPSLIVLITASLGAWWGRRYRDPVRSLFWPGLGMRFVFLLPALAPFLPIQWQPIWLILAISIPALPQGIAAVTFFVVMRSAIQPEQMTRLLSHRQLGMNLTVAVGAIVFGFWLKTAPFPLNYQVMFLAAFAFSLGSLWHCVSIRTASKPQEAPAPAVKQRAVNPWRERSFLRVAFVAAIIHLAFTLIISVVPLYLVKHMGADEGYMALFGLVELAAGATASLIAPRIIARFGARPTIALMIAGTAINAVIIALAPNLYVALIAAVFSGGCWTAAAGVGLFKFFVESTPAEEMTAYATAYNQIIGLAVFSGPMIGSLLANSGANLVAILLFGAALRLVAAPLVDSSLLFRWRSHRAASREPEALPHAL